MTTDNLTKRRGKVAISNSMLSDYPQETLQSIFSQLFPYLIISGQEEQRSFYNPDIKYYYCLSPLFYEIEMGDETPEYRMVLQLTLSTGKYLLEGVTRIKSYKETYSTDPLTEKIKELIKQAASKEETYTKIRKVCTQEEQEMDELKKTIELFENKVKPQKL